MEALWRKVTMVKYGEDEWGWVLSNVFICKGELDHHIWKPCMLGVFSSMSFARCLRVELGARPSSSPVWQGMAY